MADLRSSRSKEELIRDFRTTEILEAARRVVGKLGITEASMERIAHEAGIAKGTIYLYFKNREDLLIRVVQKAFEELMERSRNAIENVEGASAQLLALVRTGLEHSAEQEAFFQAVLERSAVGPVAATQLEDEFDREIEEYGGLIAGVVEKGVASGEFRPYPGRRFARFLTESLRGAVRERYNETERPSLEQEAESFLDLFLNGIAARKDG